MLRRIGHVFVLLAIVLFGVTIYLGGEMGAGIMFSIICLVIAYILGAFKRNVRRLS